MTSITSIDHDSDACELCRVPGQSCGFGRVVDQAAPCVCCGESTHVRSGCGAARTANCAGPRRKTGPRATSYQGGVRPSTGRTDTSAADQKAATAAAIRALDEGKPPRILAALEGPFAPLRMVGNRRRCEPFWRPPLPPITWDVRVITSYAWRREHVGRVAVLDRSGAWVSAASSAQVAHGGLTNTGADDFDGRPGYYLLNVYPWTEQDMPSPLGNAKPGTVAWFPAPHVQELRSLVRQGRWPDVDVLDSWTGDGVRLTPWTDHITALRRWAITECGRDSDQYETLKHGIGECTSLLLGRLDNGIRVWDKGKTARPDWVHTWQSQSSITLWRWMDEIRRILPPELAPVAIRNTDELVIPAAAVDLVTTLPRPGGLKPLRIDNSGVQLGTFKIKGHEDWVAA